MHRAFQVSACPLRVRASKSAVCTRVFSLRHAHASQEKTTKERENEESRGREPCPREDRPVEDSSGKNWQLYDSIPPLISFPRGASGYGQRRSARKNLMDFYELWSSRSMNESRNDLGTAVLFVLD